MRTQQNSIPGSDQLLDPSIDLQQESDYWQRLVFSLDMDNDQNKPQNTNHRSRSVSAGPSRSAHSTEGPADVEDAVLLAQFAAAMQYPSPDTGNQSAALLQALLNSQPQYHPYLPPQFLNSTHVPVSSPWPGNPYSQQQLPYSASHVQQQGLPTIHPAAEAGPSSRQLSMRAPSVSSPDPDDEAASAEDKRRRNTAASARFRIKKKQRTLNLERTVSDLTGRAEELEREASDLRRENGWLKEIVMLKGSRLAGVDLTPDMVKSTAELTRSSNKSGPQSDAEHNSSDEEETAKGKGKGKGKRK